MARLIVNEKALRASGLFPPHATLIQHVANQTQNIIAIRTVNPVSTNLYKYGYRTKSFFLKAKSCSWGPMAGFVMADPHFSKRGFSPEAVCQQKKDLLAGFSNGAKTVPLIITDERRLELEYRLNLIRPISYAGSSYTQTLYKTEEPSTKKIISFILEKIILPYDTTRESHTLWQIKYANSTPIMAVVDPTCPAHLSSNYLSATVADYDLFSIFPKKYSKRLDARSIPRSNTTILPYSFFAECPHSSMGNSTKRTTALVRELNATLNYAGGNLVRHADEGGRPGIKKIDFPFIAFIPNHGGPYLITNTGSFHEFISILGFEYHLQLNPGWLAELGFGITAQGAWEI